MLTFTISTGDLSIDGACVGMGYAGNGPCLNDPGACDVKMHGPLPQGMYTIGAPEDRPTTGLFSLPLTPHDQAMFGRGSFYIHGDNPRANQSASDGCIVTDRATRELIAAMQDHLLQVVA